MHRFPARPALLALLLVSGMLAGAQVAFSSSNPAVAAIFTAQITGTVSLQGRPTRSGVVVRLDQTAAVQTGADGKFSFNFVAPGMHLVRADFSGYLCSAITLIVTAGQEVDTGVEELPGGDANPDGRVDLSDLVLVAQHYGESPPTDPRADLNGDGTVDLPDLVLVGRNYGTACPAGWNGQVTTPTPTRTATSTATATLTSPAASTTPTPSHTASAATSTATPAGTPSPTPTATGVVAGVQVLGNSGQFVDSANNIHVVGEVFNNTGTNIRAVRVTVNFYNNQDQLVGTGANNIYLNVLSAGDKTCFNIIIPQPGNWVTYRFTGVYNTAVLQPPNLAIFNTATLYTPDLQTFELLGKIRNNEDTSLANVQAIATLYDTSQHVTGCGIVYALMPVLAPGQDSSFILDFADPHYQLVSSYRVEGNAGVQ